MRRTRVSTIATVPALLLLAGAAQANLISNGDFELGTNPGVFTTLAPGSMSMTDWVVGDTGAVTGFGSSSVDYIGTYWADHTTGTGRSVDMSGLAPGMISQDFATVIGKSYDVSFYMNGNQDGPPVVKELLVSAGNVSLMSFTNPAAFGPWNLKTFTFQATAVTTTLIFQVPTDPGNNTPYGPGLDDVSVVAAAPEPSAVLLLGFGFASLALARRRVRG